MAKKVAGIIINGATGRLGSTQHIANALGAGPGKGGLLVGNDEIVPKLLLVGRDANKLEPLARKFEACGARTSMLRWGIRLTTFFAIRQQRVRDR